MRKAALGTLARNRPRLSASLTCYRVFRRFTGPALAYRLAFYFGAESAVRHG